MGGTPIPRKTNAATPIVFRTSWVSCPYRLAVPSCPKEVDCLVSPEPVSQLEQEQRAWPGVSALVWELDGSLSVAASPVLPVADERMVAHVGQVVDEPQVAMAADARQARALLASAQA